MQHLHVYTDGVFSFYNPDEIFNLTIYCRNGNFDAALRQLSKASIFEKDYVLVPVNTKYVFQIFLSILVLMLIKPTLVLGNHNSSSQFSSSRENN
jgi:hypothetical protein